MKTQLFPRRLEVGSGSISLAFEALVAAPNTLLQSINPPWPDFEIDDLAASVV